MPPGADQAFDIGFHQDLQHGSRHALQKIILAALLQKFDECHVLFGHWVLKGLRVKSHNSTLAALPMTTSLPARAGLHVHGHSARRALMPDLHHVRGH